MTPGVKARGAGEDQRTGRPCAQNVQVIKMIGELTNAQEARGWL